MQSEDARPAVALLVKPPWARLLVNGVKTVEVRGKATERIGQRVAIAQSGSQLLVGEVSLEGCCLVAVRNEQGLLEDVPGAPHTLDSLKYAHCIEDLTCIPYDKVYAWFVNNNLAYFNPVPYVHPRGAVTWVNLSKPVEEGKRKKTRQPDRKNKKSTLGGKKP